jgi:hypothetical protein
MMGNYFFNNDSPSDLLSRTKQIHDEMVGIYNEQIRKLQIRVAILEDENKKLRERLEHYESSSV